MEATMKWNDPRKQDAVAPEPRTIVKLAGHGMPRIATNVHLTPVYNVNPLWQDDHPATEPDARGNMRYVQNGPLQVLCRKLGFEPWQMVTVADQNYSSMWFGPNGYLDVPQIYNRWDLDWSKAGQHSNPLDPAAALALATLANDAQRYASPSMVPCKRVGIALDIEGQSVYETLRALRQRRMVGNSGARYGWNVAAKQQYFDVVRQHIDAWTDLFRSYRLAMGSEDMELLGYMAHGFNIGSEGLPADLAEADAAMMRYLSGFCMGGYNYYDPYNVQLWIGAVDRMRGHVRERYPQLYDNFWICLSPYDNGGTEPCDLDRWKRRVQLVMERRMHVFLWASDQHLAAPVQDHVEYLARFLTEKM